VGGSGGDEGGSAGAGSGSLGAGGEAERIERQAVVSASALTSGAQSSPDAATARLPRDTPASSTSVTSAR